MTAGKNMKRSEIERAQEFIRIVHGMPPHVKEALRVIMEWKRKGKASRSRKVANQL